MERVHEPRVRRKCVLKGHKYVVSVNGFKMPYQICARWFCEGARPDPQLVEQGVLPPELPEQWRR